MGSSVSVSGTGDLLSAFFKQMKADTDSRVATYARNLVFEMQQHGMLLCAAHGNVEDTTYMETQKGALSLNLIFTERNKDDLSVLASLVQLRDGTIAADFQVLPDVSPENIPLGNIAGKMLINPYRAQKYNDIPIKYDDEQQIAFSPLLPATFFWEEEGDVGKAVPLILKYTDKMKSYRSPEWPVYRGVGDLQKGALVLGYMPCPRYVTGDMPDMPDMWVTRYFDLLEISDMSMFSPTGNREEGYYPALAWYPARFLFLSPQQTQFVPQVIRAYLIIFPTDLSFFGTQEDYEVLYRTLAHRRPVL
jgi:hypothetical protein